MRLIVVPVAVRGEAGKLAVARCAGFASAGEHCLRPGSFRSLRAAMRFGAWASLTTALATSVVISEWSVSKRSATRMIWQI